SAVQDEEEQPSRFLDELDPLPPAAPVGAAAGAALVDTAAGTAAGTVGTAGGTVGTAGGTVGAVAGTVARPILPPPRGPQLAELVGELRRAVCAPGTAAPRRRAAAAQLARLARAGVPGANPDEWAGLAPPTTDGPLRPPDEPVTVSPSAVE